MVFNHGAELVLRTTIACGVLETLAVILRLAAQWKNNRKFYQDDWWIVATLIPSYGMMVVGMLMVTIGGAGRRGSTLTHSELVIFLKTINASLITYALTITMVKISILLLYRRVFDVRKCRIATTILLCVCVGWGIAAILALVFQCRPLSGMWNPADTFTDKCIDLKAYYAGIAGSNMGLDIILLAMPLYMIWGYNGTGLQLETYQKIMVTIVFLLGGLVCVASLLRIITIQIIKGADLPYTVITPYIWSQIEPTASIICACITTYRPLFRGLSLRPLKNISWLSSYQDRSSSNVNSSRASSPEPEWPRPPNIRHVQPDRRSALNRFQGFIFNVPSDPSSRARTRPASIVEEPTLSIYDQMMKQRTVAGRDSGRGSAKGSLSGSWLESQSSDDGISRMEDMRRDDF